jgi:hypothetical protein
LLVESCSLAPFIPEPVPFTVLPENAKLKNSICSGNRPSHASLLEALTSNMLAGTLHSATADMMAFLPISL